MAKTVKSKLAAPRLPAEPRPAAVAVKAARTYVAKRPDTRVPALLLMLLYPLGTLGYLSGWSPLWLALACPLVAVAAWVALHRQFGDCSYTRTATVSLGLVPGWLAVASVTGVMHLRVLVCYSVAAVALWVVYARSEVLTERRARRAAQIDWAVFSRKVGLEGSGLRETTPTPFGQQHKIDILGTGRPASHWVRSILNENWAAHAGHPSEARVIVTRDPNSVRQIFVEEQTRNPWEGPNTHPMMGKSEWSLPGKWSIHDGGLQVGTDPATGKVLELPVYKDRSCKHVMIVGATGGGKTVTVNCAIERITASKDAVVWAVDTTKGTIAALWREAIDWGAGVGEDGKALTILRAAKTVIEERSKLSAGRNHHATPDAPLIVLIVDEAGSMQTGMSSRQAQEFRDLTGFVYRSARSAGMVMVFISQRGVISHTGTGDLRANAAIRVCLRVEQTSEMNYILPDWQESGLVDMSKYGEGYPGVVAIQAPGQRWTAGRTWDLSDFDAVEALARKRGTPKARLEPPIADKLGAAYANRRGVLVAAAPGSVEAAMAEDDWDRGLREELPTVAESVGVIRDVEQDLAAMQIPVDRRTSLPDLIAARAEYDRVLQPIRDAGPGGMALAGLVALTGIPKTTLQRKLDALMESGVIVREGATSKARYMLAPEVAE